MTDTCLSWVLMSDVTRLSDARREAQKQHARREKASQAAPRWLAERWSGGIDLIIFGRIGGIVLRVLERRTLSRVVRGGQHQEGEEEPGDPGQIVRPPPSLRIWKRIEKHRSRHPSSPDWMTDLTENIQRWDVRPYDVRQAVTEVNRIVDDSHGRAVQGLRLEIHYISRCGGIAEEFDNEQQRLNWRTDGRRLGSKLVDTGWMADSLEVEQATSVHEGVEKHSLS